MILTTELLLRISFISKGTSKTTKPETRHKHRHMPTYYDQRVQIGCMLYFSSFLDQIYKLRSNYRLTRRHWVQLWAATVRECNGQMLHYLVILKWNTGSYLYGLSFETSLIEVNHLFLCLIKNSSFCNHIF
jgi:hypothetical protein